MVDSTQELQDVESAWVSTMNTNGMRMITAKGRTELMHISRRREEFDMYMEDKKLHQTNFYKYLGVLIDELIKQETELKSRIKSMHEIS